MRVLYTAGATARGGREGEVLSDDGVLDLELAVPHELGGPGGDRTNPEQLFAAGYAACFHSALQLLAGRRGLDVSGSAITAQVRLGADGTGFALGVTLTGLLPGLDRTTAQDLMAAAHEVCPYSNATRGNIEVDLRLDV